MNLGEALEVIALLTMRSDVGENVEQGRQCGRGEREGQQVCPGAVGGGMCDMTVWMDMLVVVVVRVSE